MIYEKEVPKRSTTDPARGFIPSRNRPTTTLAAMHVIASIRQRVEILDKSSATTTAMDEAGSAVCACACAARRCPLTGNELFMINGVI